MGARPASDSVNERKAYTRALVDSATRGGLRTFGPSLAGEIAGLGAIGENIKRLGAHVVDTTGPAIEDWWNLDTPFGAKDEDKRAFYEARRNFLRATQGDAAVDLVSPTDAAQGAERGMRRRLVQDTMRYPGTVMEGEAAGDLSPVNLLANAVSGKKTPQYLERLRWTESQLANDPIARVQTRLPIAPKALPAGAPKPVAFSDVVLPIARPNGDQRANTAKAPPSMEDFWAGLLSQADANEAQNGDR